MPKHEFDMIQVETKEDSGYLIHGLKPDSGNFRDSGNWETLEASMLKINDFAFAFDRAMEISEYQKTIIVNQETENGLADIILED